MATSKNHTLISINKEVKEELNELKKELNNNSYNSIISKLLVEYYRNKLKSNE
jgi:predicted CopG family antitoxin